MDWRQPCSILVSTYKSKTMLQYAKLQSVLTYTIFILIISTQLVQAQRPNSKKVQEIGDQIEKLGSIFDKKKKKTSSKISSSQEPATHEKTLTKNTGIQPGDIHPQAKYIDAERMLPFNDGAAIVMTATLLTALINEKGEYIVPYKKYKFVQPDNINTIDQYKSSNFGIYGTGLFLANDELGYDVVITSAGNKLEEPGARCHGLSYDGKYAVFEKDKKYIYINKEGKKFTVDYNLVKVNEGIGIYRGSGKLFYVNLENKIITRTNYTDLEIFSEGLAVVRKNDDYSGPKFGYINTKGIEVIPCKFSNKPSNFHCGLAKVKPQDDTEFKYVFIDKAGNIKLKFVEEDAFKYGGEFGDFFQGYSFAAKAFLDTTGKITFYSDFLNAHQLLTNKPRELTWIEKEDALGFYRDGKWRYTRTFRGHSNEDYNRSGYIDLKSGKNPGFVFGYHTNHLFFDVKSKLAYAERYLGKNNKNNQKWTKGYINEDGIFMIVMAEKSKW